MRERRVFRRQLPDVSPEGAKEIVIDEFFRPFGAFVSSRNYVPGAYAPGYHYLAPSALHIRFMALWQM